MVFKKTRYLNGYVSKPQSARIMWKCWTLHPWKGDASLWERPNANALSTSLGEAGWIAAMIEHGEMDGAQAPASPQPAAFWCFPCAL